MRIATVMLAICCCISAVFGQWIETTIQLGGLGSICVVQFHSPNHTVYVGGDSALVAVDAGTHQKSAKITFPGWLDLMCSSTASNKLYCASSYQQSVWVVDCATNQLLTTVPLDGRAHAMCYATASNKAYVACPPDSLVNVIDCDTDSLVAKIQLPYWPSALCYNPELNRIYVAKQTADEVAVIDCAADTVIHSIWVHGARPTAICYCSATNCVYTLNYTSGTLSVIDCAGDSVVRIVPVGGEPEQMVIGPQGKVYCGGYSDSAVTIVESQGTRTIPVGRHLSSMSFDPVNSKVYCATSDSVIVVIDAIGDTVAARVAASEDLRFVCYDPADTSTWVASVNGAKVCVIDGASDKLVDRLFLGIFDPGALCYSPASNRLYCLARYRNDTSNMLIAVDGDSNRILKILPSGSAADSMIWNPANNKVYFSHPADNMVSVLDCASDSITAAVETGARPDAMCCSDDGKVYVTTNAGGVAVIDPSGDSIRAFVPTPDNPRTLCYDRTDNKVYAGLRNVNQVSVIDVSGDSVVATIPVVESCEKVCWNPNHDKVYVCGRNGDEVPVIDCTGDTVLKNLVTGDWLWTAYNDSVCDKVYFADVSQSYLWIADASRDRLHLGPRLGIVGGMLDNGRPYESNRFYCTTTGKVNVLSGATDSILRVVQVGVRPTALAWNPVHSWVYVSDSGSSSITVIRDTLTTGVEEGGPQVPSRKLQATMVRGVLFLPRDMTEIRSGISDRVPRPVLLDVGGRKVLDLHPGANDVRVLSPGVYFIRERLAVGGGRSTVHKVVVAR